MIGKRCEK